MSNTFVTEEEIRQTLLGNLSEGTTSKRELMRSIMPNRADSETTGSIMYLLSGSPPRGYAIYTPELRRLNFYSPGGERIEQSDDVDGIAEVNDILRRVVALVQEHNEITVTDLQDGIEETPVVHGPIGDEEMGQEEAFEIVLGALKERGVIVETEDDNTVQLAF